MPVRASRGVAAPPNGDLNVYYWVLVPQEDAEVAVVNASGYHIFQQCDGVRSEADIAQAIAEASGANIEHVRRDVAAFVARLTSAGLLAR